MSSFEEELENDPNYQSLTNQEKSRVREQMRAFYDFEQTNIDQEAPVSEADFKKHILPALAQRDVENPVDLTVWQRFAGTLVRPIVVFDTQTRKKLFVVPPPLRRVEQNLSKNGKRSLAVIAQQAEQQAERIPAMGDVHIQSELTNQFEHVPVDADAFIEWDHILRMYGYEGFFSEDYYERLKQNQSDPTQGQGQTQENNGSDLEDGGAIDL